MTPYRPAETAAPPAAPPTSGAAARWGMVFAAWGVVALADVTQARWHFQLHDATLGWPDALERNLPGWVLWALFTPLVVALARRHPVERATLARALPVHVGAALALGLLYTLITTGVAMRLGWPDQYGHTAGYLFMKSLGSKLHLSLLLYAAVVGLQHAAEYRQRLREREAAAARLQARLAEAQLQALRTQLQPHFLFNTLNAVSVLALKGDTQCVVRMLSRLSELLRLTLESSAVQEVPLRQELELLERYLDIERVRFQDRMTVEVDVAPEALDVPVPNLILQPLVENSVRHGLAQTVGAGRVEVRARRHGDRLRLEVRDTGPGLPPGGVVPGREGVGLSNVRSRLSHLYGDAGRFELRDAPGGGALAVVEVPFRPGPSPAAAEPAPPRARPRPVGAP